MCRVLKVARAGFYDWLHKPLSDRAMEDQRLLSLIRDSYVASGGVYGSPRVFADLLEAGQTCGKHRVARIMQTNRIKAGTRVQVTALGQWASIHPLAQQAEPAIYGGCT